MKHRSHATRLLAIAHLAVVTAWGGMAYAQVTMPATTGPTGQAPMPGTTNDTVVVESPQNVSSLQAPEAVRVHDFMDTRLTWTFGDNDLLTPQGERVPNAPLPSIGDRQQYQLFFDSLNTRYPGRENLTHLVLYARAPGFIPRIVTEGALVVRMDLTQLESGAALNQTIYDAGSYLRVQYRTNLSRPQDGLSFTFFPFDTDRFRLGYLWALSWGGNAIFPQAIGGAPGARIAFDSGPFTSFIGFKTAQIVVPLSVTPMSQDIEVVRIQETQYAALAGAGYRFTDMIRFDVGGGYFQQGRFDIPGVRGEQAWVAGASARLVINHNLPPATSIDMLLYRNHPDFPMAIFAPEVYTPGEISWLLSFEVDGIAQNLANIDVPGATALQPGYAAAFLGRIKIGYLGISATALYRDLSYTLINVPSFVPFQTIPNDPTVRTNGELFGALALDYRIPSAHVTPTVIAGVQSPATFSTEVTEGALQSQRTLVIRSDGNFSILPPGDGATPIFSARASLRWDLSTIFAVIAWAQFVFDDNGTLLFIDQTGTHQLRYFENPAQVGFGLTAQARY